MVVLSFFLGCSSFDYQIPNYEKIADRITARTAEKLKLQKPTSGWYWYRGRDDE